MRPESSSRLFPALESRIRGLRREYLEAPDGPRRGQLGRDLLAVWQSYGKALSDLTSPQVIQSLTELIRNSAKVAVTISTHDDADCRPLASLPWECFWLDGLQSALGLQRNVVVLRTVSSNLPASTTVHSAPIHVTMAAFGPYGPDYTDDLDTDAEWDAVNNATADNREAFEISEVDASDYELGLLPKTDILHLSSHGSAEGILLAQWAGTPRQYSADEISSILRGNVYTPQVLVLSACVSAGTLASGPDKQDFSPMAGVLCQDLAHCVVAMRDEVTDLFAADFAFQFYNALAVRQPISISDAIAIARQQMAQSFAEFPNLIEEAAWAPGDWFIPVLFQRLAWELEERPIRDPNRDATAVNQRLKAKRIRRPAIERQLKFAALTPERTVTLVYGPGGSGKSEVANALLGERLAVGHHVRIDGNEDVETIMAAIAELASVTSMQSLIGSDQEVSRQISRQPQDTAQSSSWESYAIRMGTKVFRQISNAQVPIDQRLAELTHLVPYSSDALPAALLIWENFERLLSIDGEIEPEHVRTILEALRALHPCHLSVLLVSRRLPLGNAGEPWAPGINIGPLSMGQARRLLSRNLDFELTQAVLAPFATSIGLYPGPILDFADLLANGSSVDDAIDTVYNRMLAVLGGEEVASLDEDCIELLAYASVFRVPVDWYALDYVGMYVASTGDESRDQSLTELLPLIDENIAVDQSGLINWPSVGLSPLTLENLEYLRRRWLGIRYRRDGLHRQYDRLMRLGLLGVVNQSQGEDEYGLMVPRWIHTWLQDHYEHLIDEGHLRAMNYWMELSDFASSADG